MSAVWAIFHLGEIYLKIKHLRSEDIALAKALDVTPKRNLILEFSYFFFLLAISLSTIINLSTNIYVRTWVMKETMNLYYDRPIWFTKNNLKC